ncbi:MAG: histidine kinase [Bacteroidetes bacterium]|nr:histidine kinase [Bacteroidota bacterium]
MYINNHTIDGLIFILDTLQNKTGRHTLLFSPEQFWQRDAVYIVLFFMISIGSALYVRYNLGKRHKKHQTDIERFRVEKELQRSQLQALKVQMNPHFMFNALNCIQEFILMNEKTQAMRYLGKFSDLMRMTLDMSEEENVRLSDEIKCLRVYLDLEALRFGEELKIDMRIDDLLKPHHIYVPSMLIQPYVENALKHGLLHKKGEKQLDIGFRLEEEKKVLFCTVNDNGIGRERSGQIESYRTHKSFATSATKRRLELLNADRDTAISVQYTDKLNEMGESIGTTVVLAVPVELDEL